jgi:hypothetical protein
METMSKETSERNIMDLVMLLNSPRRLRASNGSNSERTTEVILLEKYLNMSIIDSKDIAAYMMLYNICLDKCNKLLEEELNKNQKL